MPAISVIIPTYQRRELVRRAAASVLAQTCRDFELIVVDDGSNDGTGEALAGLDRRLRYVWQPNRGVAAARNAGLRLACGPLVAFLDSDDRWLPCHLAVTREALARHPAAVLASTCPHFQVAGRGHGRQARLLDPVPLPFAESLPGYPSGVVARREALFEVGGFDERLLVFEDRDLWQRLAVRGPFAIVQRRTIVRQNTRNSLRKRGSRRGYYLEAFELSATRQLAELERMRQEGCGQLAARAAASLAGARASVECVKALQALSRQDEDAARAFLREACQLLPALSSEPGWFAKRIELAASGRAERLAQLEAAAALWPDRRVDAALFLQAKAILAALSARRPRKAAKLLAGWPLPETLGFVSRTFPLWVGLARRALDGNLHRGRETAAL